MNIGFKQQAGKYFQVFALLYLLGFAAGIIVINVLHKKFDYQSSILGIYIMSHTAPDFSKNKYFCELLSSRGMWFLFYAVSGITAFGIPLVIGGLIWLGFLAGSLITMFLMEYGVQGMLLGFSCFFPQCLFYIPGAGLLCLLVYQMSQKFWQNRNTANKEYRSYGLLIVAVGVVILWGILMESFVNYNVVEFVKKVL